VEVLRELPASGSSPKPEIENFKQYVGRIATNVCINFIRAKSPGARQNTLTGFQFVAYSAGIVLLND